MPKSIETLISHAQLSELVSMMYQHDAGVRVYGLSNGSIMARLDEAGHDYIAINPSGGITRPGDYSHKREEVGV